ncbi:hypothetical protein BGZ65_001342 [Modicella reniformis]|uniref:Uncharacterized protein n=1 Tax=Modicella reniformis TaxID=1440133 RepID=A0A9P6INQ0_9FUNG|nr:hypothetical protein BGZ65_001342 [Modicella reniformis]
MSAPTALRTLRLLLTILSVIVFASGIYFLSRYRSPQFKDNWIVWIPLILAIISECTYSISLRGQTYVSSGFRKWSLFLIAIAWLVPPSYDIHQLAEYYGSNNVFKALACSAVQCKLIMTIDICSYIIAIFALLELFISYRYECSQASGSKPTAAAPSVFVSSGAQQYIPLQQQQQQQPVASSYAYNYQGYDPSQPLQPAANYPQPAANPPYHPVTPVYPAYQPASIVHPPATSAYQPSPHYR